jgi:hypothetical protein
MYISFDFITCLPCTGLIQFLRDRAKYEFDEVRARIRKVRHLAEERLKNFALDDDEDDEDWEENSDWDENNKTVAIYNGGDENIAEGCVQCLGIIVISSDLIFLLKYTHKSMEL